MKQCLKKDCNKYEYREPNNCVYYSDVLTCRDYKNTQKHKTESMEVCLNRRCGAWGDVYIGNCRDDERSVCRSYKENNDLLIKQEINKMDQFESTLNKAKTGKLVAKVDTAKESLIETAKRTKNTVVRIKVGRLAITAIKSALKKTPGIPVYAKMLLDSEYADIVIGAVTPIIVPMITDSARAKRLSEDINIAGGVAIADKLTFIDDFVAQIIEQVSSAIGPEDLVEEPTTDKL